MKLFILKITIYLSLLTGLHLAVAFFSDGSFDEYYWRFANGKHASFLLGSSRAAQGLQPAIFNNLLKEKVEKFGNFSFTVSQSPIGEVYFRAIRQKMDTTPSQLPRVYVLTIEPWSLANENNLTDDPKKDRENALLLAKTKHVGDHSHPNFEYLIKNYSGSWGALLKRTSSQSSMHLHRDGWLEVNVPMDSAAVARRTQEKVNTYRTQTLPVYSLSARRWKTLDALVAYLKQYGKVCLVRLPVDKKLLEIENELDPLFNEKTKSLAEKYNIPYWDYTPQSTLFEFIDGNHLHKKSGAKISEMLAERIAVELLAK